VWRMQKTILLIAVVALFVTACGGGNKGKLEGQKSNEILEQKAEFLVLYMAKSGVKKFAPDGQPFVHDPIVNKIYWRVMECTRPTCPGRIEERPHLFIVSDNSVSVDEGGAIVYEDSFKDSGNVLSDGEYVEDTLEGLCPKCERGLLKPGETQFKNDGLTVSDQMKLEKKKLKQFVKPYYAEGTKPSAESLHNGSEIQKK
jgi:hypothetical protein